MFYRNRFSTLIQSTRIKGLDKARLLEIKLYKSGSGLCWWY